MYTDNLHFMEEQLKSCKGKPKALLARKAHSASGAHSGRGSRYQDEYGALIAVMHYVGLCRVKKIVPVGIDDFEVHTDDGVILIATNSKAKESRPRSVSEDATVLRELWEKSEKFEANPVEFLLVLNEGHESYQSAANKTAIADTRLSVDHSLSKENPNFAKSFVVIEPFPLSKASEILINKHGVPEIIAKVICTKLKDKLGELASKNTSKYRDKLFALCGSEIAPIVNKMLKVCQISAVEALLLKGHIKHVDFSPAEVSKTFYLNVDVRPGHITSGQVVPMPKEVKKAKEKLISMRSCLIFGPSGSGKSALMWQIAHSTREDVCWFEVTNSTNLNDEELTLFLNARSKDTRIGFIFDNVTSDRIKLFEQLVGTTRSQENVWILGSIRTEALYSLTSQRTVPVLKVEPDQKVARNIFVNLQKNRLTKVPFWIEAWQNSNNLLEFTCQLVEGNTLEETVTEQLKAKQKLALSDDSMLDMDIAILKALMPVTAFEGKLDIPSLKQSLVINDNDFSLALQRLNNEFLRLDDDGEAIFGLHSLRSFATCEALVKLGLASRMELARNSLLFANSGSLENVTYNVVYRNWLDKDKLASAIEERLSETDQDFEIGIAFANGFRQARIQGIADNWCSKDFHDSDFPPIIAIPIAFHSYEKGESILPREMHENASKLSDKLFEHVDNIEIPQIIVINLIGKFCQNASKMTPEQITRIIQSLYGVKLNTQHLEQLKEIELDFIAMELDEAIQILDAVVSLSKDLYKEWITRINELPTEPKLANRLQNETPYALTIKYEKHKNYLLAKANIANPVLNDPSFDIDHIRQQYSRSLLISDDKISCVKSGITDFSGRDTPPIEPIFADRREPTFTTQFFSQMVALAIAKSLATDTWTNYLKDETDKLKNLYAACNTFLNEVLRNSQTRQTNQRMQKILDDIEKMVAPVESYLKNKASFCDLAPIHKLTCVMSFSLERYIRDLPNSFAEFIDRIKNGRDAIREIREEPWHLTENESPEILSQIESLMCKLEILAVESNRNNKNPIQMYSIPKNRSKNPFDYISERCSNSYATHMELVRESVISKNPDCKIVNLVSTVNSPIIVYLPMRSKGEWITWCQTPENFTRSIEELTPEERQVIIIPVINNKSALGYKYQSMRKVMIEKLDMINMKDNHFLLAPDEDFVQNLPYPNLPSIRIFPKFIEALGFHDFIKKKFDTNRSVSHEQSAFEATKNELDQELEKLKMLVSSSQNPEVSKFIDLVEYFLNGFDLDKIDFDTLDKQKFEEGVADIIWKTAIVDS